MEKINFSISINAPKEKVWQTLWNKDSYKKWTTAFAEGSDVVTNNWEEGSKVLFVDDKGNGMVSKVAANKPNEYMSFMHLGEVKNGTEDTISESVKQWSGAMENYTLQSTDKGTQLFLDMDIPEGFKDYFIKTWPIALQKIKDLSEQH